MRRRRLPAVPSVHRDRDVIDPSRGGEGLLGDALSVAVLTLILTASVWLAATVGELVALWRMGASQ